MTENNTGVSVTEDVYQAHRANVLGDRQQYREPIGGYIEQIHAYANTRISAEESRTVRCATFNELDFVCDGIAAMEEINPTRMYPALRLIGYNHRYHNMKCGDPDPLFEMANIVKSCRVLFKSNITRYANTNDVAFGETRTAVFRMHSDAIAVTDKDARYCGIRVSQLNMFNVLDGINVLIENEPDYTLLKDNEMFNQIVSRYTEIKQALRWKVESLKHVLDCK